MSRGEPGTETDKLEWACRQIERLCAQQAADRARIERLERDVNMLAEIELERMQMRAMGL